MVEKQKIRKRTNRKIVLHIVAMDVVMSMKD